MIQIRINHIYGARGLWWRVGVFFFALIVSCGDQNNSAHRYQGKVDADVLRISARTAGVIDSMFVREGDPVQKGMLLAVINSRRSHARMQADRARLGEIEANRDALRAQIAQLAVSMELAEKSLKKITALYKQGAATEQQFDEADGKVRSLKAQERALRAQEKVLDSKKTAVLAALRVSRMNRDDARIPAPEDGMILTRLHNPGEWAAPGMPLFEMAHTDQVDVICYLPLTALTSIRVGDPARIFADGLEDALSGTVSYISDRSEFTPKTILTKETRTTLVYRVKITVNNSSGSLKLGMPVDVELGS
ncbi:MAG: HlyD family efflux transporter periplasmic adaptor subunit [Calditrichaeota bacterium]|nr:MAG: HlyD family efflux transporter periplasmic adaptor subunit [Calditrichota bacterium]